LRVPVHNESEYYLLKNICDDRKTLKQKGNLLINKMH